MDRRVITLQPVFDPKNPKRSEPDKENHGFDILSIKWLRPLLLWKHTRTVFQLVLLVLALAMIFDGFFGDQFAPKNFSTVAGWIDYRFLLVLSIIAVGSLFCMACPFVLVSRQIQKRIGRNLNWPKRLKGKWLSTGLLLLIFWIYEVFSLWDRPLLTAGITLAYFVGAIGVDAFYKGNSFCKYVCPIGLFTQACSIASPTEVKSKSFDYCRTECTTKDCINGNPQKQQQGCQTFLYLGTKQSNMDCTYCLDCVKACPHDNIALQFRAPTHELSANLKKRDFSVAAMLLFLTFAALANAGGMVKPVQQFEQSITQALGLPSSILTYSVMFLVMMVAAPLLFGWLATLLTQKVARTDEPLKEIFKRYAPAMLPLAFGIWTAHYLFHFVVGGAGIWPTFVNLFASIGLPIFGQPDWRTGSLLPYDWIFPIQTVIIYGGFMLSALSTYQISRKLYKKKIARRAMWPWIGLALLVAVVAILILLQPMQARGTFSAGG